MSENIEGVQSITNKLQIAAEVGRGRRRDFQGKNDGTTGKLIRSHQTQSLRTKEKL